MGARDWMGRRIVGWARRVGRGIVPCLLGACGGASLPEAEAVDVEAEMDRLFGCALIRVAESGREVATASRSVRTVTSQWASVGGDPEQRERVQVSVFAHPWFGPGLTVVRTRDEKTEMPVEAIDPDSSDASSWAEWSPLRQGDEDQSVEQDLTRSIVQCWQTRRSVEMPIEGE